MLLRDMAMHLLFEFNLSLYGGCAMTDRLLIDRELLEELRDFLEPASSSANHVEDVRAMVADPSPAGVDGLEVETYLHTMHMELGQTEQFCSKWKGDPFGVSGVDYSSTYSVTSEPLCRLSDAQAIIDGLRGDIAELDDLRERQSSLLSQSAVALRGPEPALTRYSHADIPSRVKVVIDERDHLAQCLKFARTTMAVVANNANLRGVEYRSLVTEVKRIDAALAAVCAAAPNIATTSEHSGS